MSCSSMPTPLCSENKVSHLIPPVANKAQNKKTKKKWVKICRLMNKSCFNDIITVLDVSFKRRSRLTLWVQVNESLDGQAFSEAIWESLFLWCLAQL